VAKLLHWAVPLAMAALLSAIPRPEAAPEAPATGFALRIEVYAFAGIHVLTNRTTIDTSPGRYRITTDIGTRGIARLFIDLNSHSVVDGRVTDGAPLPLRYHSEVVRNGVDRRYRIDYALAGPLASEWMPPGAAWQAAVPPAKLRGTVDQLTAYFILEQRLAADGNCDLVVPVFDGAGRYNLRFRDEGSERLRTPPVSARVCDVRRDDIAGFPGNGNPGEATYKSGRIWYARLGPGGRMVPVRIDYDTEFGVVTGYLAEISGPDGVLHLSE
jgi:Protein of unknown function (DUF3108)